MKPIRLLTLLLVVTLAFNGCKEKPGTRVLISGPGLQAFPSWSPDGRYIVYQHTDMNDTSGLSGLWRVKSDGSRPEQLYSGIAEHPRWSPDNRFIVFDADTGNSIKMLPVDGGGPVSFLPDSVGIMNGGLPCWSPDGSSIAFLEGATRTLCTYNLASGTLSRIFSRPGTIPLPGCWAPSGDTILAAVMNMETRRSVIEAIAADGSGNRQIEGHHENLYRYLALSPDGRLLAYAAMEEGRLGLYLMPYAGGESIPIAISPDAHNEGVSWSPDGKKVTYNRFSEGDCDIFVMSVDARN